ncbi:MAG: hypothetical protein LBN25_03595, partial [Christensenellaceae bacterium]|nr:hypothetical protein [Christensenellaceae bacterium]
KADSEIRNAVNYGNILSSLNSVREKPNEICSAIAGGVIANNFGNVYYCANFGEVKAYARDGVAISGGIIAQSLQENYSPYGGGTQSVIENCIVYGKISAESGVTTAKETDIFAYCGGVAADCVAKISSCIVNAEITGSVNNATYYCGAIVGVATDGNTGSVKNWFLKTETLTLGMGAIAEYDQSSYFYTGVWQRVIIDKGSTDYDGRFQMFSVETAQTLEKQDPYLEIFGVLGKYFPE